ncbi:MAG: hypothetical protein LW815_00335 [Chitinophagaceae bacterium]|jgi:OOP family OmpA-OmpF porin|nr:hypothetical protein [Chitinophagaceae bacterium]
MKRILLFVFALVLFQTGFAQSKPSNKKSRLLGIQFTGHDFETPADLNSKGMSFVLTDNQWSSFDRKRVGMAITYTEGLNDKFDFNARLGMSNVDYTLSNKPYASSTGSSTYTELDANLFMKLLTDDYVVSPFLSIGAGASVWKGYYASYMPAGVGLQFNLFDETFFTVQSQYRIPVTGNAANNLFFSIGVSAVLDK